MIDGIIRLPGGSSIKCECLVIGSGAGGALTASFLSERGKDVLIAEEGPFLRELNGGFSIANALPEMWRDGGVIPVSSNCSFVFGEGRCLGGTTMINSGFIASLPEEIAMEWARDYKIDNFEHKTLSAYQGIIERDLNVGVTANEKNLVEKLLKKGSAACGFKGHDTPMAVNHVDMELHKNHMQRTYLKRAVKSGCKIITDCRVNRIFIKENKAYEAQAAYRDINGVKHRLTIRFDSVFISAGAIQTPLLLRRSGIKKNIGNTIRFHPTLRIIAEFEFPVNAYSYEIAPFKITEFSPEITMGASQSAPAFIASGLSINWESNRKFLRNFLNMAIFYVMSRSHSNGIVRNIPFFENSYSIKYPLDRRELRNLSFGYAKLSRVLFAAGAKRLYPSIQGIPSVKEQSESDHCLTDDLPLRDLNIVSTHSFSSCPMGERRDVCAVDSFGRLHGFENIYINDASILPDSPAVNPQGPLMSIALRNIENILK